MLRSRDVYPGSWFLPIPDPGSKNSNKRKGWKKICCHNFLCSHKFHKIANYFSFEVVKKNIWANFQRIIELFTQKIVTKLSKIWIWDPGSRIRKKPIPDPGSRGQKGTGSRIRIRNTEVRYSKLLHLPPLRFHCFGRCWDRTQDVATLALISRRSNHSARSYQFKVI